MSSEQDGQTPLMVALEKGHVNTAKNLISQGANVALSDHSGMTPLHYPVEKGNVELMGSLLPKGADIGATSVKGTPLQLAVSSGNLIPVGYLLNHGAKPNSVSLLSVSPKVSPITCSSSECFNQLLKDGANPKASSYGTRPPALEASIGKEDCIKIPFMTGANPNSAGTILQPKGLNSQLASERGKEAFNEKDHSDAMKFTWFRAPLYRPIVIPDSEHGTTIFGFVYFDWKDGVFKIIMAADKLCSQRGRPVDDYAEKYFGVGPMMILLSGSRRRSWLTLPIVLESIERRHVHLPHDFLSLYDAFEDNVVESTRSEYIVAFMNETRPFIFPVYYHSRGNQYTRGIVAYAGKGSKFARMAVDCRMKFAAKRRIAPLLGSLDPEIPSITSEEAMVWTHEGMNFARHMDPKRTGGKSYDVFCGSLKNGKYDWTHHMFHFDEMETTYSPSYFHYIPQPNVPHR